MIGRVAADALAMLDNRGWTQGACEDERGVCLGTALCRAAGLPEDGRLTPAQLAAWVALTDAVLAAQQILFPDEPFDTTNVIPMLNDHSPEDDVRAVLRVMTGM